MLTPAPTADQQQLIDLRSMYRVIHVLGTDLPPTQVQQHRQAIHDLVHPAAGRGGGCADASGNVDQFMGHPEGPQAVVFKAGLIATFIDNEASFSDWYRVNAPVDDQSSGFTIGPP